MMLNINVYFFSENNFFKEATAS